MGIASILTLAAGMLLAGSAFVPQVSPHARMISAILGLGLALYAVVTLFLGAEPGVLLWTIALAFALRNFRAEGRHRRKLAAGEASRRHPGLGDRGPMRLPSWGPRQGNLQATAMRPGPLPASQQSAPARTAQNRPGQATSSSPTANRPHGHYAAADTRGLRPAPPADRWGKPIPPGSVMDRWGNIIAAEDQQPI